jgi:hypothetical protein
VRKLFTSLEFRTLHERLKELKLHASAAPPALELTISELRSETDLRPGEAVALAWSAEWLALCDDRGKRAFAFRRCSGSRFRTRTAKDRS